MNDKKYFLIMFGALLIIVVFYSDILYTANSSFFWSFAIIADPHIQGDLDHKIRLKNCVDWINHNKENKYIELVFVLGDIAWGNNASNFIEAKIILDELNVPYIPLIGDNEVNLYPNNEIYFAEVFEPQYILLSTLLTNWQKAPTCVWNPDIESYSYFQNFSFDYNAVHFVAADWAARTLLDDADLHNFADGTWPWFADDIVNCQKLKKENIVMLSHHPMYEMSQYSFNQSEFNILKNYTVQYTDHICANFAGHFHINGLVNLKNIAGYKVYITDATFDDKNTIRIVYVLTGLNRCYYFNRIYEVK